MKAQSDGLFSFSPFLFFFFIFFSYRCKYEIFAPPENSLRSIKMWNNLRSSRSPNLTRRTQQRKREKNIIQSSQSTRLNCKQFIYLRGLYRIWTQCVWRMMVLQSRELVTSLVKGWILKTWLETSLVFLSMRMEFPR